MTEGTYDGPWIQTNLGKLTFSEAWPAWWEQKEQALAKKTKQCYREYFRALSPFFGKIALRDIEIEHIVSYRQRRQEDAGPNLINHEINVLKQLMDYHGLWRGSATAKRYKQLRIVRGGPGLTMTDQEAQYMFQVAQTKPRWRLAYLCAMVSGNTGAGAKEVLSLRLKDVDFNGGNVSFIEGTKPGAERTRTIPMNDDCRWALAEIVRLAAEKRAEKPDHYIFPKRAAKKGGKPDPTQHMESNFRAWYAIRTFAAKTFPNLTYIGRYKLRHYALTHFAQNPDVSEMTVKQMAGHGPYSKMLTDHYVHIREKAQRVAVNALPSLRSTFVIREAPANTHQAPPAPKITPALEQEDPLDVLRAANGI